LKKSNQKKIILEEKTYKEKTDLEKLKIKLELKKIALEEKKIDLQLNQIPNSNICNHLQNQNIENAGFNYPKIPNDADFQKNAKKTCICLLI